MVKKGRLISQIFLLGFCVAGLIYLQMPLAQAKKGKLSKEEAIKQEQKEKVKVEILAGLPNFGFNNLIADWNYLQFVQYFGDIARDDTGYSLNPDYFRLLVKKDPRFITPYFIMGPATTLFSGRPDISVKLMSEGLKSISPEQPQAYQVWLYKGIDELLFVDTPLEAKKSYEMAAKWAKFHDDEVSQRIGQQAQQTANFLRKNPNSKEAQAVAWMSIFGTATDDNIRKIALDNIRRLGGKITIKGNIVSLSFPEED